MTVTAAPGTTGAGVGVGVGVGVGDEAGASLLTGMAAFCTGATTEAAALVDTAAGAVYAADETGETEFEAEPEIITSKQVDHWFAPLNAQTQTIMWRPGAMFFGL